MLKIKDACFVLVDVQGKLAQSMDQKEQLFENLIILIKGMKKLNIPMLWMEQIPEKLGPTLPEFSELLTHIKPFWKSSFSGCGSAPFREALVELNRKQVIIAGIETHICVYQTTVDLLDLGYHVEVVCDAVSSRTLDNKSIGLKRIKNAGANQTSTEMVLFELLKNADHPEFKEIAKLVK